MPRKKDPGEIRVGPGLAGTDSVEANAIAFPNSASKGLGVHVGASESHPASSISIDDIPPFYDADTVEGALDELGALIPVKPPTLGNDKFFLANSGLPDWGILKLADGSLIDRGILVNPASPNSDRIYPYYFVAPEVADEVPPSPFAGNDPEKDTFFNVVDGTYTGGGPGLTHAGAFKRVGGLVQTARLLSYAATQTSIVSGIVSPADRGVLALLHWPDNGNMGDFLAQALDTRCVAAILLGQGLTGEDLIGCVLDSDPGGMFDPGDTSGTFDPFAFPGQATGQYALVEMHTGTPLGSGTAPIADNTVGQVRLGSDLAAGLPLLPNGIPILGGTTSARGGGNDDNFFRYRLPVLADYSQATGVQFTTAAEKDRYFLKPAVADAAAMAQAGNYADYDDKFFTFQIARYRYRFTLPAGAAPREDGQYILAHFKSEEAFEDLVRDGTAPTDDKLHSANLVDWTNPEFLTNLTDSTTGINPGSYHILRASIFEDNVGTGALVFSQNDFDYQALTDEVMTVSGIKYFLPRESTLGNASFEITDLTAIADNLFENTFRTSDDIFLRDINPGILILASFSFEDTPTYTVPTGPGIVDDSGRLRRQHIEFAQEDLFVGDPDPADLATMDLPGGDTIEFLGDDADPSFVSDAKPRVFFRRPLGHDALATTVLPASGQILDPTDSNRILYHSINWTGANTPIFGNFLSGGSPLSSLYTVAKDTSERFLDESYRYAASWVGVVSSTDQTQLLGPGLPSAAVPIEVPVRGGISPSGDYEGSAWISNTLQYHLLDLGVSGLVANELQVTGLPDRNPPLSVGAEVPFPSRGMVLYPQFDYTTNFRPSFTDGDLTGNQFDYSSVTGDRVFIRAFDAAFSRGAGHSVAGQPFFIIRVLGLQLADFAYAAPGPGTADVAVLVKVPGLTTWMDLGRVDGGGPSKQDPAVDGAGCKVIGADTFDTVDSVSGIGIAQIKVNVGPSVNLFASSGAVDATAAGEVPVLVKVIIKDTAGGKSLDFGDGTPTIPALSAKGIVGLEIVEPT